MNNYVIHFRVWFSSAVHAQSLLLDFPGATLDGPDCVIFSETFSYNDGYNPEDLMDQYLGVEDYCTYYVSDDRTAC